MVIHRRHHIARQIGWRVRTGQAFKGLTTDELAARVGLTPEALEQVESGAGRVTADDLVALARALELPIWFFFDVPLEGDGTACPVCRRAPRSARRRSRSMRHRAPGEG